MNAPSTPPTTRLTRAVSEPIRSGLTWDERWTGRDGGLIACWERGREMRAADELYPKSDIEPAAARAERGELLPLPWKGGVAEALKAETKLGCLQYLAMWQGLRNEDLDIDVEVETPVRCTRTGQVVMFTRDFLAAEEPEAADPV